MADVVRSRKWMLTINNPVEHGFNHEYIRNAMESFSGCLYWCMCDEVGDECETLHTHVYAVFKNGVPHTQIDKYFPKMHRDVVKGKSIENRSYIRKEGEKFNKKDDGSYEYTDSNGKLHKGINYIQTFEEWGEMPQEHQGKALEADLIIGLVKAGATDQEIINEVPRAYVNLDRIQRVRSMYRDEQFTDSWRDLTVTYIFGVPGAGKSRSVMDKYGYRNVYRVTDYKHPFDTYDGQDVVVFEDYRSNFKITDILNYLDGYPLLLPCRYFNRQACFTKVYITSNLPLEEQHKKEDADSKKALYRRIHAVVEYTETDRIEYDGVNKYFDERRCDNG